MNKFPAPILVLAMLLLANEQHASTGGNKVAEQDGTWHLTDGLSWQQLAAKVKIEHLNGTRELYFSQAELAAAVQIVAEATRRAVDIEISTEPESVEKLHVSPSAG